MSDLRRSLIDVPDNDLSREVSAPSPSLRHYRRAGLLLLLVAALALVALMRPDAVPRTPRRDALVETSEAGGTASVSKTGFNMTGAHVNLEAQVAKNAINAFDDLLISWSSEGSGIYYEFETAESETVWSGQVEGRPGSWASSTTSFPLASASKLFLGVAAMYTMERKPDEFYPEKFINEFKGWEDFKDFPIYGTEERANLTIQQLLLHTSGLPFALRDSREDIRKQTLFFPPGTAFGYTLGHRVIGWLLRDFWKEQPEAKDIGITTVEDTFKWLFFDILGLSCDTTFIKQLDAVFGYSGEAADGALQSTGEDLMKLAVLALRRGRLPSGETFISEANWNKWATANLLPGGKLTKDLVGWQSRPGTWQDWNVRDMKAKVMKQHGAYGWNYFGAIFADSGNIGWCGFFSSCLRVSYSQDLAFVLMQRDMFDLKKSKAFVADHMDSMAKSLQCAAKSSVPRGSPSIFCEKCKSGPCLSDSGGTCRFFGCSSSRGATTCVKGRCVCKQGFCAENGRCENPCEDSPWTIGCPSAAVRLKTAFLPQTDLDEKDHSCYVPLRHEEPSSGLPCHADTGGTCRIFGCSSSRGSTACLQGKCLCEPDFCAREGQCVPHGELASLGPSCCQETGGTCRFLGCDSSRGPATCVNGLCKCLHGFCAEAGRCIRPFGLSNTSMVDGE